MAWKAGWQYRKKITIAGQSGAGTGYQVLLKVGEGSGSLGAQFHVEGHSALFLSGIDQGGDLLFTASDETTPLSFWVESVTGIAPNRTADVWVRVSEDLAVNREICCYYGNANAANGSSGADTFDFFDDFTGSELDEEKWGKSASGISVANSVVTVDREATDAGIWSLHPVPIDAPFAAEIKYQRPSVFRNRLYFVTSVQGWTPTGFDMGDFSPSIYWAGFTGITLSSNTWYIVRWLNLANNYTWKILNLNLTEVISRSLGSAVPNAKYFHVTGTESSASDFKLDWARVRKYASVEPSFLSATEEMTGGGWLTSGYWWHQIFGNVRG